MPVGESPKIEAAAQAETRLSSSQIQMGMSLMMIHEKLY